MKNKTTKQKWESGLVTQSPRLHYRQRHRSIEYSLAADWMNLRVYIHKFWEERVNIDLGKQLDNICKNWWLISFTTNNYIPGNSPGAGENLTK